MDPKQRYEIYCDFVKYCHDHLQFQNLPTIKITKDQNFAKTKHSFGLYNHKAKEVVVYDNNRNLADCLRTLAHELVHHKQNEMNMIGPHAGDTGSPIENQANSYAGIILRNYGKSNPLIYESRHLTNLLENPTNYRIYCDMDGVLCDFEKQFDHYFGLSLNDYAMQNGKDSVIRAVDKVGEKFWSNMPWTSGGKQLWDIIADTGVTILTSPDAFAFAKIGKYKWIQKNLNPAPKNVIFKQTGKKHTILNDMYPEEIGISVLIDDYSKNIIPWKESGGIGIKYEDLQSVIPQLTKIIK